MDASELLCREHGPIGVLMTLVNDTPVRIRDTYIREDRDANTFRVNRAALRDAEVFRLEQERIWAHSWLYLGHESEIGQRGDYRVRTLGGRPLIFCRDDEGRVHAYFNSCPHRGTTICRDDGGNARFFRCFYHAWT